MTKTFQIKEKIWLYPGKAAWYFITIPQDVSKEIDFLFDHQKRGWGSLPVRVSLGKTTWMTSIFPDKKTSSYLLPVKADVRKKEDLKESDVVDFSIEVGGE